jgi:HlyD family secretion protein
VARAQHESSTHQTKQARAGLSRALEDLSKTTIVSPICGTVTKLKSQAGERVVGSAMMAGTEIMTVANLDDMEARVDIGETDVVLIGVGQKARLEVDAFRDRKFNGTVTEIANSVKGGSSMGGGSSQEAAKFEVKIRIGEKESFRPGMSVTAEVETRYRTNVLTVPIQSVTTRLPKPATNSPAGSNLVARTTGTNAAPSANPASTNLATSTAPKKAGEPPKPIEVVFVMEGDHVKMVPVKRGISDDNFTEIAEGLAEGQKVISGGYKAINRDLEDGSKVKLEAPKPVGPAGAEEKK